MRLQLPVGVLLVGCMHTTYTDLEVSKKGGVDSEQHARHYRRILISQGGIISVLTKSKRRPEIADACRRVVRLARVCPICTRDGHDGI